MTLYILLAVLAGILVGVSRQLNGRLSIATTALVASFWNHIIGFAFLTVLGLGLGGLLTDQAGNIPWWAWFGGPIGVAFVAAGSWLIARIGATATTLLIIAGQMITGVVLDMLMGHPGNIAARTGGIALILLGMGVMTGARR